MIIHDKFQYFHQLSSAKLLSPHPRLIQPLVSSFTSLDTLSVCTDDLFIDLDCRQTLKSQEHPQSLRAIADVSRLILRRTRLSQWFTT